MPTQESSETVIAAPATVEPSQPPASSAPVAAPAPAVPPANGAPTPPPAATPTAPSSPGPAAPGIGVGEQKFQQKALYDLLVNNARELKSRVEENPALLQTLAAPPPAVPPTPVQPPAATPPPAAPAAATPPNPAVPATPPPPVPAAPVEDVLDPIPAKDSDGKLPQMRFRPTDEVEQTALAIARRLNKSVLDPSVVNAAYAAHGLPVPNAAPAPAAPAAATPAAPAAPVTPAAPPAPATVDPNAPPATLEATDAKITELRAQRREARSNFDFDAEDALETQITSLERHRFDLHQRETTQQVQQQQTQEQARRQAWDEAGREVVAKYPDAAKADSAITARARELQATELARDPNSPLAHDPRSLLYFHTLAAQELNIAPAVAAAPVPQPPAPVVTPGSPTPTPVRPPASAMISPGAPQPLAPTPAQAELPKFKSPADYHAWLQQRAGVTHVAARV